MTIDISSTFQSVLRDSLVELLKAYSVTAEVLDSDKDLETGELVSVVGYTADHLKGNVALVATNALVLGTAPKGDLTDWAGELANQLMGRIKNKLLRYGVALELSTPVVVSGLSLQLSEAKGTETERIVCSTHYGAARALFNFRHRPEFSLSEPSGDSDSEAMAEGELLLF